MSDDLISRKALLEAIDSSFIIPILKINMREEYKAVLRIREIIANMQTGFDKEKVIEELKQISKALLMAENFNGAACIDKAIEIVRERWD